MPPKDFPMGFYMRKANKKDQMAQRLHTGF